MARGGWPFIIYGISSLNPNFASGLAATPAHILLTHVSPSLLEQENADPQSIFYSPIHNSVSFFFIFFPRFLLSSVRRDGVL